MRDVGRDAALEVLPELRELQGRALEAVAAHWLDPRRGGPRAVSGRDTAPRDEALRQAAAAAGVLAEAARRVATAATAAGTAGWTRAVEVADAISTVAQALRMLAELELAAIPGS